MDRRESVLSISMKKRKVKPIIFGGEQQKNMRSGTENVPGIAGIGAGSKDDLHRPG